MNIFSDEKLLAEALAKDSYLYNYAKLTLRTLEHGLAAKGLNIPASLEMLERANDVARNSDYYVFEVFDEWAERTGGIGEGYCLYQMFGEKLVEIIGLNSNGVPEFRPFREYLSKKDIKKLFTTNIPFKGRWGSKPEDIDGDGDMVSRKKLSEHGISEFISSGIEVIVLD